MGRPKKSAPSYRYHISGQGIVSLCGKTYYLGPYNTPESMAKYYALIQKYNENGLTMPDDDGDDQRLTDMPVTVRCVTAEFRQHIEVKYAKSPGHKKRYQSLCGILEEEYGDEPASDFGPRKLAAVRELFVASGNCRNYANEQTRSVCAIFRHAVSRELIGVDSLARLKTLEPLKRGQTSAKESKPRGPADIDAVRETAKHLSPTVRAMVIVQVATGMRPSEVCMMRPMDIDKTGTEWIYRPEHHKTAHHGVVKAVPIVGDARMALKAFINRAPDQYLFSPAESAEWYREQRWLARKTPPNHGNRKGINVKSNPKRSPGKHYTKDSYRKAITQAAKKAKVAHWTPYSLRYTAAATISEALGLEAAQAMLGHTKAAMTSHYAGRSELRAIEAAKAGPKLGTEIMETL
ncbi:tyrosine-type recombinase/integrase [Aporhodopirellula aestuarii]|uniref:Site-specific integrase n=1 Tax=Aporhodopirellula aestuarii TaxID=2950107 RepID=A0ABT0TYK6_9BACT|nr:site-specific integrase [Aporhodopirellula aestuarii]MCM2369660.1 site-specific integrase [Aporhodopirellula aestuarii]